MKIDFEQEEIPVIPASLHFDILTDSNYIFFPMASYSEQVVALGEYIDTFHPANTPKVALYVHPSTFGRSPAAALNEAVNYGLNIDITETIEHVTGLDISAMLTRFVSQNVQYVICQTVQAPVAELLTVAENLGITASTFGEPGKITFLGAHYTGGNFLISLTGSALTDYYWITSFIGTAEESEGRDKQWALADLYGRSSETANSYLYTHGIMVAQTITEVIKRLKSKNLEVTRSTIKNEIELMNGNNNFMPETTVGPVTFSSSDHTGVNTLQIYNIQENAFKAYGDPFVSSVFQLMNE